eukprot:scpid6811/ scgid8157/ 
MNRHSFAVEFLCVVLEKRFLPHINLNKLRILRMRTSFTLELAHASRVCMQICWAKIESVLLSSRECALCVNSASAELKSEVRVDLNVSHKHKPRIVTAETL